MLKFLKDGILISVADFFPMFSKPEPEITDKYIRIRVKDPDLFLDDTFKWVTLSEDKGIHSIQGKLKEDGKDGPMTIQSYVFEKEKWTLEEAQDWVKEHNKCIDDLPAIKSFATPEEIKAHRQTEHKIRISGKAPMITDGPQRIIEGWASTNDVDRYKEIVTPEAFRETLPEYMKNSIMYFGHEWWALPIGKVISAEIRDKGLWIKAMISETAGDIWKEIEEGILKCLSIGYRLLRWEDDAEKEIRTLLKIDLMEISVVGIPANPNAIFEAAKAKGLKIEYLKTILPAQAGILQEGNMDPKLLEELVARVMAQHMEELKKQFPDAKAANQAISEMKQAVSSLVTKAELDAFAEKYKADAEAALKAIYAKIDQEWIRPSKKEFASSVEQAKRMGFTAALRDEKGLPSADGFKSLFINEDPEIAAGHVGMLDRKHLVKELQQASDDLLFLGAYKGMTESDQDGAIIWKRPPTLLKAYAKYKRLLVEFCKALDTETAGEGLEWLPTFMSGTLITGLDAERGLIKRIPRVGMPSKSWPWPLLSTKPVAYKKAEARNDANINTIILSTAGTGNITFSAKGVGIGSVASGEELEDSIVPILPELQRQFRLAILAAEENAIINGDDSTTHQDTDTAAGSSALIQKLFKGLRYMALNASTSSKVDLAAAISHAGLVSIMEKAGKYGIAPQKGFFIVPYAVWFDMLTLTEYKTQDVFGQLAANLTGQLPRVLGSDVLPSEFMRSDLNSSGVNGASGNTKAATLYLHPDYFMVGDRRIYTVESDRMILSDQVVIVGTERIDFQKMAPALDTPVSLGYNITV